MRAFGYEQRAFFFGRERQSHALYRLTAFGFIAVIGASGSGKSSLVRAGLIPLLYETVREQPWRIATMTPGGAPIERLADTLATLCSDDGADVRAVRRDRIEHLLRRSSSGIADALGEISDLAGDSVLIVVDQFEELFRDTSPDERDRSAAFVQLLLQVYRHRPSAHVLITMRSDFIGDCAQFLGLPEAVSDNQFLVPSLSREERRATIVNPLERAGATIAPTLVERILNDASLENDQLPILQHALMRMWISAVRRDPAHLSLTEEDYRSVGKLDGAISEHANEVARELPGSEHVVEAVFRALSERDPDGRAVRRVLTLQRLVAETGLNEADVRAVVNRFRAPDAGFLLPRDGALALESRIDVVHEALLRGWDRMTSSDDRPGWLEREEDDGRYYRSLLARIDGGETTLPVERTAERYAWWTDVPHTQAWAERYGGRRDRVSRFFTDSLLAKAEHEAASAKAYAADIERRRQRERAARRFIAVVGSIATVAVLLLVVTFFALLSAERTKNASLVTQSDFLSRDAEAAANRGDATDAALFALEALPANIARPDRPFTWSAYGALTDALGNLQEVHSTHVGGFPIQTRYLANERGFVTWTDDGTITIWNFGERRPFRIFHARSGVEDVGLSPDGTRIVAGCANGTIDLWNVRSSRLLHTFDVHGRIQNLAISWDGKRLLASTYAFTTAVFDLRTFGVLRRMSGQADWYLDRFTPYGRSVLVVGRDGNATLWDSTFTQKRDSFFGGVPATYSADGMSPNERFVSFVRPNSVDIFDVHRKKTFLRIPAELVSDTMFSQDGRVLGIRLQDAVDLWDVLARTHLSTIPMRAENEDYSLSADGTKVGVASTRGSVDVWSTAKGVRLAVVGGFESYVTSNAFNHDSSRLIASADDGTVREWDLRAHAAKLVADAGRSFKVMMNKLRSTISSDGAYFAISNHQTIRVFDTSNGSLLATLPDRSDDDSQTYLAFSPNDRYLATSNSVATGLQIWDWRRATIVGRHDSRTPVGMIEFSPDGTTITSALGFVRLRWATTGGTHVTIAVPLRTGAQFNFVRYSRVGNRAFGATTGGSINVIDPTSDNVLLKFQAQQHLVDACISRDGHLIATASRDKTVRIWDASTGAPVALRRSDGFPYHVDFSADGERLLIAATDSLRIWNVAHRYTTMVFRGFEGYIRWAALTRGDRRIVSVGSDRTIRLWDVPNPPACQNAIDEALHAVPHGLSRAVADAEFMTPRRSPSLLDAFLPHEICR